MKNGKLMKVTALLLVLVFLMPFATYASEPEQIMPLASYYLDAYQTYICCVGGGEVQVWFHVAGAGTQDELGVLSIKIYESSDNQTWAWKETFLHDQCEGMLVYNEIGHMSHVTYQGTAGKYYKAYVCFWGGSDGSGDTRYVWTSAKLAT